MPRPEGRAPLLGIGIGIGGGGGGREGWGRARTFWKSKRLSQCASEPLPHLVPAPEPARLPHLTRRHSGAVLGLLVAASPMTGWGRRTWIDAR